MQENSHTYETMDSWVLIASEPHKIHQINAALKAGANRKSVYIVQTTADDT